MVSRLPATWLSLWVCQVYRCQWAGVALDFQVFQTARVDEGLEVCQLEQACLAGQMGEGQVLLVCWKL